MAARFDDRSLDHVAALAGRLGIGPIQWVADEGRTYSLLICRAGDRILCSRRALSRVNPQFTEPGRAASFELLAADVVRVLLDDVAARAGTG